MAIHKIDGVDAVDGGDVISSFPKKFVTLHCEGAVTAGQWVQIGTDTTNGLGASVKKAVKVTTDGCSAVIGIATETLTAAGELKVQTAGKYENASVDADVAAGIGVQGPDTTDGMGSKALAAGLQLCGIALEAASSNLADVMIIDQGAF